MPNIQIGLKGQEEMVVERQDLASVMENIGAEVLSTHRVVLLMELAARNAIKESFPKEKMKAGTFFKSGKMSHIVDSEQPKTSNQQNKRSRGETWMKTTG